MYELVNKTDHSRISRTKGRGSNTLFDTAKEAQEWGNEHGCNAPEYEVLPALEAKEE